MVKLTRRAASWLLGSVVAVPLMVAGMVAGAQPAGAQDTLRVVMHSDLKIVDPIWTTAYISRNYGYMVYDTLFALDEQLNIQPQMVDSYEISDDQLVYTFTLRDGLLWHDGAPVTSEDAIVSIERWGQKDSMGLLLMSFVEGMKAVDDKTFEMRLKEPYGLVLLSLAKPSSNVPFMMPKRIAETPASEQISEYVGSGPFVFERDQWEPGTKSVFTKFADYQPRGEPPSWAAGGKVAKVDRVEWIWIPDHQTAVNALVNGEIDVIEAPPHDLLPVIEADDGIALFDYNPLGNQYMFRMNWLHPPFDNQKVREAAIAALNQEDFLRAVIGDPRYYKVCPAMFICDTPFATDEGAAMLVESHFDEAKALLEEAGYDGTPVTLMHSTDLQVLTNLAPVAKQLLEKGGFTVDMQSMDWQTLVSRRAKKEPPAEGGWSALLTSWVAADVLNPISTAGLTASCDTAWFGWPCDEQLEQLRLDFATATDPARQTELAHQIQARALEIGTHAYVGQWYQPIAHRDTVAGLLHGPAPFFWNVSKSE
jgi:peptide/nickel transport system substrate-binding protein